MRKWAIRVVAVLVVIAAGWYYVYMRPTRLALQRWAEIGRPMPEFEAAFRPMVENQSLRELKQDVKAFEFKGLYRGDPSSNLSYVNEIVAIISAKPQVGDGINLEKLSTTYLDAHSDALAQFYQRILARDAPSWNMDQRTDADYSQPSYIASRQMSQLCTTDARRRIARGDIMGAREAMRACSRLTENLDQGSNLVGVMIRCAIEGLMLPAEVQLPTETDEWVDRTAEVEAKREVFRRALQMTAWENMHRPQVIYSKSAPALFMDPQGWWKWINTRSSTNPRTSGANLARMNAGVVEIIYQLEYLKTDLGAAKFDMLDAEFSTTFGYGDSGQGSNFQRAWHRQQIIMLFDEEVRLIRLIRARLDQGRPIKPDEFPSFVVPDAHWMVTLDAEGRKATFQLSPMPAWAIDGTVAPMDAYPVQPDGSQSWQYAPAPAK